MENKRNQEECRKCGGTGKPSKGLVNYHFIDKSYLRGEKEFVDKLVDCIKCQSCGHSWIPETSAREKAMGCKPNQKQFQIGDTVKCIKDIPFHDSKGNKNTINEDNLDWFNSNKNSYVLISNQKQFKSFDKSLFKAYIDKFSDEDKVAALAILLNSFVKNHWEVSFDNRNISKFMEPRK